MKISASEVLRFWFGEGAEYGKAHKRWFEKNPAFDAEVRTRFSELHEALIASRAWLDVPHECLARIIVLDQFPRNMFRGTPRAFATDALALAAARHAIASGYDRDWLRVEKIFGYLPFEHSEALADQQLACELMRPLGEEQYDYAVRHKDIIERFGRFPHRNAILGRESTPEEIEFLKQPGSGF
jgi:uncharacterized protein (DUF924 family)